MTDKVNVPYVFKQQTPEHQATMKIMCEFLIEEGYTPDDIIDAGDYLLDQMSLAELTGEKKDAKQYQQKKAAKGTDSKPAGEQPAKSSKAKEGKKGKGKKGKSGKGKSKKV